MLLGPKDKFHKTTFPVLGSIPLAKAIKVLELVCVSSVAALFMQDILMLFQRSVIGQGFRFLREAEEFMDELVVFYYGLRRDGCPILSHLTLYYFSK